MNGQWKRVVFFMAEALVLYGLWAIGCNGSKQETLENRILSSENQCFSGVKHG
jgi:hypothetical protein